MTFDFETIFEKELDVVNFRRRAIGGGAVEANRPTIAPNAAASERFHVPRQEARLSSEPGTSRRGTVRMQPESNLTGLAFSGGGIRSAAFCLGASQALDSLPRDGEPGVFDAFDYLSTVSGGGYIGTSIVSGMMQEPYTFPFASKLDAQETEETKHLRNYSNFLAPNGVIDYLTSGALLIRGLLVNLLITLPALLLLVVISLLFNPRVSDLDTADVLGIPLSGVPMVTIDGLGAFTLTINLAILGAVLMFASAIATSLTFQKSKLITRERLALGLGALLAVVIVAAFVELQPLILSGMLHPGGDAVDSAELKDGVVKSAALAIAHALPALASVLLPAALVLIGFAQKLANVARAALGEASWTATLKKYGSRIGLYVAGLVVPLMLWVSYLYLTFWALRTDADLPAASSMPGWLTGGAGFISAHLPVFGRIGAVGSTYVWVAAVLGVICLFIGPNSNSLNQLYRDRLSRAFLFERLQLSKNRPSTEVDRWRFSSLKQFDGKKEWRAGAAYSPYLLVNTAINLIASKDLNKRGRNADNFIFSPLFIGSEATRYVETKDMERAVPSLSLATAMATSGAAASANMGNHTVRILTFSLSLLNVRLGYWLANPRRLKSLSKTWARWWSNVGTWYFATESAGLLDERKLNVYLTDGGHIENTGIYELLRRRCKVIVAIDAEADPSMTFEAFVKLQVMARIDFGIRIELPWRDIQKKTLSVGEPSSEGSAAAKTKGPHAAVGIIHYGENEKGILFYVKSSLSGDENDYIADYKRRNPTFPHETTLDQFFSEEQFEVYRALAFHAVRNFFCGDDDVATPAMAPANWNDDVIAALGLLNVPTAMRACFRARLDDPSKT
ncbi:patatin-like phospholipase family protein [Rhizobium sp. RAF56]|uniref:patatin-like phospholipase family protein n=1 Tax=Rhizobium sp. RAF56 TaxID=3233062 RepID=UPI003F9DCD25